MKKKRLRQQETGHRRIPIVRVLINMTGTILHHLRFAMMQNDAAAVEHAARELNCTLWVNTVLVCFLIIEHCELISATLSERWSCYGKDGRYSILLLLYCLFVITNIVVIDGKRIARRCTCYTCLLYFYTFLAEWPQISSIQIVGSTEKQRCCEWIAKLKVLTRQT